VWLTVIFSKLIHASACFCFFLSSSKAKDVSEFFELISAKNNYDIIGFDNSKKKHLDITVKKTEELDMMLLFLLLYSPDRNQL